MNKHNSKAVAILACLLSSCSIASAHPAQKILGNESNLKQSKSDNSSNGGLTTTLTSIALLGAAGGLGLEAYYYGAFSDPSEDNESKKFLASSSTPSSSSSDVQIPEFIYDENGERIYLYKAAQLEQNPVAKQMVYNMIYNGPVKNGTLEYWQETYFKNMVSYFGLVGTRLENVNSNDDIHFKLFHKFGRKKPEFFDNKKKGNILQQHDESVSEWYKAAIRKALVANRNTTNAVVQPKLENKADNVMFSKPAENVTPMATESIENEDSYVSQNFSPAPFDSTDVGMTPETDQGTDGTMYTKPAINGYNIENNANEREKNFSIFDANAAPGL